jgi:hypothetical protein
VGLLVMDITGFFKKRGIVWPFKPRAPVFTSFPLGPYSLDMEIAGLSGLREFSKIEYREMTRQFKGERIYHGPDIDFLGHNWKIRLNAVSGKIYKITAYIETKDKELANVAIMDAFLYCKNQMGEPNRQRNEMFIWEATDSNVSFQTTQTADGFGIDLFLTSHAIRDFTQLR